MPLFPETIPNFNSVAVVTATPTVTNAVTILVPANSNRKGLTIKNTSNRPIYIGFTSSTGTSNYYVQITIGNVYELEPNYLGDIYAISTGSASCQVTEFV